MNPRDIGSYIKPQVGISPISKTAATVTSAAIDRGSSLSCVLHHFTGTVSGSPSAQNLASKLQSSADGSTGWADVTGGGATTITAASTENNKDIDLSGVTDRYVRVSSTVSFTGGTSPAMLIGSVVILGPQRTGPI